MRLIICVLFIISSLTSFFWIKDEEDFIFEIALENGDAFKVVEIKDKNGLLEKYKANIEAPVCEEGVCYNVNLIFYWNLIGEFLSYETLPNDPLTKLDHVPFLPQDYEKLQQILTSQDLNFVRIPAKELVEKIPKDTLDGYSGATKETVKKEVIAGALYTCYTLWHIANGAVKDSIEKHILTKLDKNLVQKVIDLNSQSANYFLINNLNSRQFEANVEVVLPLVKNGKGYFTKNAIEKMPTELFKANQVQAFVIQNYEGFDYYSQSALLNKLTDVTLNEALQIMLVNQISEKNSFQNQRLADLIIKNGHKTIITQLIERLVMQKIELTIENYTALSEKAKGFDLKMNGVEKAKD